jgi:hypothetical protein
MTGRGLAPGRRCLIPSFRFAAVGDPPWVTASSGGDGGIRTLDRALQPYNGLANRRLQPLGHVSGSADMPDASGSRKQMLAP